MEIQNEEQKDRMSQIERAIIQQNERFEKKIDHLKQLINNWKPSKRIKFIRSMTQKELNQIQKYLYDITNRYQAVLKQKIFSDNNQNLQKIRKILNLKNILLKIQSFLLNFHQKRIVKTNLIILEYIYLVIYKECSIKQFFGNNIIQNLKMNTGFKDIINYQFQADQLYKVVEMYLLPIQILLNDTSQNNEIVIYQNIIKISKIHQFSEVKNFAVQQPTIFSKISQFINFNDQYFTFQYLNQKYPKKKVNLIAQKSFTSNINDMKSMLLFQTSIQQYIQYLNNSNQDIKSQTLFQHFLQNDPEMIFSCLNIPLQQFDKLYHCHRTKITDQIRYKSRFDLLGYLEKNIEGITTPYLQIKNKNSWIGATQLYFQYLNFNHGPDSQEWYIHMEQEDKKISCAMKNKKIYKKEFYQIQGLLYLTLQQCIKNNIKITKVIQKKGQLILIPPGAIFWMKSLGKTINTSWQILRRNLNYLTKAINYTQKINIFKKLFVPLKNVILQWSNFQYGLQIKQSQLLSFMSQKLNQWIQKQSKEKNQYLQKYPFKNFSSNNFVDIYSFCIKCKNQFLMFFGMIDKQIYCLKCILNEPDSSIFQMMFKNQEMYYQLLLKVLDIKIETQKNFDFKKIRQKFLIRPHYIGTYYNLINKGFEQKQFLFDQFAQKYKYMPHIDTAEERFLQIVKQSTHHSDINGQKQLNRICKYIPQTKRNLIIQKMRPYLSHLNLFQRALNILRPLDKI